MSAARFKACGACGRAWTTREEFLGDPAVVVVGYQVNFGDLTAGLFLFNHACGTTLSMEVGSFLDLHTGPVFRERAGGGPDCPSYCMQRAELRPCATRCECAFVRAVLHRLRTWPKRARERDSALTPDRPASPGSSGQSPTS